MRGGKVLHAVRPTFDFDSRSHAGAWADKKTGACHNLDGGLGFRV